MEQEVCLRGGGRLLISQEGIWVRLETVRPDDGRGLYKVWVRGEEGEFLLGTLVPERGMLRLCRRISQRELERCGCWPVTGAEAVLTLSFAHAVWHREEHPERLVKESVLRQSLQGCTMLVQRQEHRICLAAEYHPGRPFPLPALFCLCRVERIQGRAHAVFCFDPEGNPVVLYNGCDGGENSGTTGTKEELPWQYSPQKN